MTKKLTILIFDCAIKTPSTLCIERLSKVFDQYEWKSVRAPEFNAQDFEKIFSANIFFIFGSYSNVDERLPWHSLLANYMSKKIEAGHPTLGICFGHQLMADYYGGEVSRHKLAPFHGLREANFHTAFGDLKKSIHLGVSHSYEVSKIPKNFEILASSEACQYEAIKHRSLPYFSFQAHPEASEFFFKEECPDMSEKELKTATTNGLTVIASFLQIAEKVLANSSKSF